MERTVIVLWWSVACLLLKCGGPDGPPPAPPPPGQLERRDQLEAWGVRVDDGAIRLSDDELDRFVASVGAYHEASLIDGVLAAIRVEPGDPRYPFGSRPEALLDRQTLRYWTWTANADLAPGSIFADLPTHLFYFAHELGHLVHATSAPELAGEFLHRHQTSRSGTYDGRDGPPGDFVTAYAERDVLEDFAECFSFLTFGRFRWLWGREMRAVFTSRPELARKLLAVANAVAGLRGTRGDRWPVFFEPEEPESLEIGLRWVRVLRAEDGRIRGFVIPAELDPAGGRAAIGCRPREGCGLELEAAGAPP